MSEAQADRTDVTVTEAPERRRYEATDDSGVVAGFVTYDDRDGLRALTHTEVDPAFEGRGVGSALARGTLDTLRGAGTPVKVECGFLRSYIKRHPEYADLVAH